MRNDTLFAVATTVTVIGMTCFAQAAQLFDQPVKEIHVPSSTNPSSGDAMECIYYSDIMIRMYGTDTPSPNNATIIPNKTANICSRMPPSAGITVKSEGYHLAGRKGRFLVFDYVDWIDFDSFMIVDAWNGHVLFDDGFSRDFAAVRLTHGALHLRYTRGVDLPCSLLSNRDRCWSEALATGQIPRGAFPRPPSLANCEANYFAGRIPDPLLKIDESDPSVVFYDVDLTLDINGHATIRPLGDLTCDSRL